MRPWTPSVTIMNDFVAPCVARGPALAPGPVGLPWIGSPALLLNPLRSFERLHARYGPVARAQVGPYSVTAGADPAFVRRVMIDNAKNYTKSRFIEGLGLVLGRGLVTSDGAHWKRQRRLAHPAFRRGSVRPLAGSIAACVDETLAGWDRRAEPEIDVHAEMSELALRVVFRTLFGVEERVDLAALGPAVIRCLGRAQDYATSLVRLPLWLPTPSNIRFRRAKRQLDHAVDSLIEQRRSEAPREDLLGMLMAATDGDQGKMTTQQLHDEVMTLFVAGHETMTNAMSWIWMLLAQHPDVASRVRAEADSVLGGRPVGADDLDALTYTGQVIQEALRLYPPIWAISRRAIADDQVGPWKIPAGSIVSICPWVMHRRPDLWEQPSRFDPERFAPGASPTTDKYAYLPFGAGPRVCIGAQLAMMEAKIILASVIQRYRVEVHAPDDIAIQSRMSLGPRDGMPARLERIERPHAGDQRSSSRARAGAAGCPFAW